MDFRIRQLEYYLVLAEHLNFGKAARVLNIAQPTLSFQIKSLETSLGVSLFDRTQRRVQLTPEGVRLQAHAKAILEQARRALIDMEERPRERLTIACGPVGQHTVLPDVLRELRLRDTGLDLEVQMLSPEAMKMAAVNGTVDALLMTPDWQLRGMEFTPLRAEKLSAVLPESHPAVERASISLAEFAKSPIFIASAKDCHKHRGFVTGLLEQHGLTAELVEAPLETGIRYAMVAAGKGVGLAAGSMARANFPGIRVIPFDRLIHNMVLGLVWQKGNASRALEVFREVVEDVISTQNAALIPFPPAPVEAARVEPELRPA
jgi:DNA-binding transcriptional LysR family regulator